MSASAALSVCHVGCVRPSTRHHLLTSCRPFWLKCIDSDHGGITGTESPDHQGVVALKKIGETVMLVLFEINEMNQVTVITYASHMHRH